MARKKGPVKENGPEGENSKAKGRGKVRFKTAEEFEAAAEAYFDRCDATGVLYSPPGLALALGVTEVALHQWWDGTRCPYLQEAIQMALLRISNQIWTDPRYMEKGGMATKAIFYLKQPWLGGLQDRIEAKQDLTVNVKMGGGMDESDFK